MHGVLTDNVHYWTNTQGRLMISKEVTKELMSFDTIDEAINNLYFTGHKEAARLLNAVKNNN